MRSSDKISQGTARTGTTYPPPLPHHEYIPLAPFPSLRGLRDMPFRAVWHDKKQGDVLFDFGVIARFLCTISVGCSHLEGHDRFSEAMKVPASEFGNRPTLDIRTLALVMPTRVLLRAHNFVTAHNTGVLLLECDFFLFCRG